MLLELVDLRPNSSDDRWWVPPFADDVDYEHPHWWNRQLGEEPWFVQVLDQTGTQVARVEFDDPGGINPEYANVPNIGVERLEIQFLEVAAGARGRGVGGRVVRSLMERHPDRRLLPTARAPTASGIPRLEGVRPPSRRLPDVVHPVARGAEICVVGPSRGDLAVPSGTSARYIAHRPNPLGRSIADGPGRGPGH